MIKKIDHIVITTEKIRETLDFYEKLGFVSQIIGDRYSIFAGDFKINLHIKGHELLPHAKNPEIGSCDLCFEITESIGSFKEKLEAQGLFIELGIVERSGFRGSMNSIYLRDPNGNLIEFCKYN